MNTETKNEVIPNAEALSAFVVIANSDLADCLEIENYEQAALIRTAIELKLANEAYLISERTSSYTVNEIFNLLKSESDYVLKMIQENNNK